MPIYMDYNNNAIKGGVTAGDYKGWIEVNSFQWGVGRGISSRTGNTAEREASAPSVSEIVVTKTLDAASPLLCQEDLNNSKGVDVKIFFVRTGSNNKQEAYLKFTLNNTLISGYSISSGGDRPTESISLNFTKFLYDYSPMKPDGTPDNPNKVTYDISEVKAS